MGIGVLIKISCKLRRWNFLKGSMVKLPILQGKLRSLMRKSKGRYLI
ncbi:hypothetical protein V6Z11_A07G123900 [Gossypium hirsutum]